MTEPLAGFTTTDLTLTGALQEGISDSPGVSLSRPRCVFLIGAIRKLQCIYYLCIIYYYAFIKITSTLDSQTDPTVYR